MEEEEERAEEKPKARRDGEEKWLCTRIIRIGDVVAQW